METKNYVILKTKPMQKERPKESMVLHQTRPNLWFQIKVMARPYKAKMKVGLVPLRVQGWFTINMSNTLFNENIIKYLLMLTKIGMLNIDNLFVIVTVFVLLTTFWKVDFAP